MSEAEVFKKEKELVLKIDDKFSIHFNESVILLILVV
jgi:hypothetical protein